MEFFLPVLIKGVSVGVLYAIAATGFVMIFQSSRVLNFAHGGLMAMGAFIFLILSSWGGLPILFSFVLTLAGTFAIGLLLEKSLHHSFTKSNPVHGAVLTIGLALIFKSIFAFLSRINLHDYSEQSCEALSVNLGTVPIPGFSVAIFIVGGLFFMFFGLFFTSSQGIYMRSTIENRSAAFALGVPVKRMLALSWAIAAMACAITGIALGILNKASISDLGFIGLKVFPVVVLGGLNSIWGAILGGILIGVLEALTKGYISASLGEIIPYVALFVMIVLKPGGFIGTAEVKRSWQ